MLLEYRFDTGLTRTVLGAWFGHRRFQLLHFCIQRKRQIEFTAYTLRGQTPCSHDHSQLFFISSTDVVATCMYAQQAVAYAEGGSGGFSPRNFLNFRLKNTRFFKFRGTLPNVFFSMVDATSSDRTILSLPPVVIAQPQYSNFTAAVNAFQQAPTLQGRKLIIGWKT